MPLSRGVSKEKNVVNATAQVAPMERGWAADGARWVGTSRCPHGTVNECGHGDVPAHPSTQVLQILGQGLGEFVP